MAFEDEDLYGLPRRRRRPSRVMSPDEEQSLTSTVGSTALGFVEGVGNLLDVPGSMLRDVASTLTGTPRNPLDQLLSPFSGKNRITGRELNRQWGLADKKDTWGNFGGGILTEVALDPLTWVSGGLTKGGQILAKTPVLAEHGLRSGIRGIGPRAIRYGKTVNDVIQEMPNPSMAEKAFKAAAGDVPAAEISNLLGEKVGGIRVGVPGVKRLQKTFETPWMLPAAKAMDKAGRAVRGSYLGREAARLVDPELGEVSKSFEGQLQTKLASRIAERKVARARGRLFRSADELYNKTDVYDPKNPDYMDNLIMTRRIMEDPDLQEYLSKRNIPQFTAGPTVQVNPNAYANTVPPNLVQDVQKTAARIKPSLMAHIDKVLKVAQQNEFVNRRTLLGEKMKGLKSSELDDYINTWTKQQYVTRSRVKFSKTGRDRAKLANQFDTSNPNNIARQLFGRDLKGGTEALVRLSIADNLPIKYTDARTGQEVVENAVGLAHKLPRYEDLSNDIFNQVQTQIIQKYGDLTGVPPDENLRELAKWVMHLDPRHATEKVPAFELDPFSGMLKRQTHSIRAQEAADNVYAMAVRMGGRIDSTADPLRRPQSLKRLLEKSGLDVEAGARQVQRQIIKQMRTEPEVMEQVRKLFPTSGGVHGGLFTQVKSMDPKEFADLWHVPDGVVEDASRAISMFTKPEVASGIGAAFDWFNKMFTKSVTTPFPNFHIRNKYSGMFQNWMKRLTDPRYHDYDPRAIIEPERDANKVLRGDYENLDLTGEQFKGLDKESSYKKLWSLLFAHNVVSRENLAGQMGSDAIQSARAKALQGFRGQTPALMPGGKRSTWRSMFPEGFWKRDAETLGQKAAYPFTQALHAGRQFGNYVEATNRIAPFIALLRQNVDPAEAARRVNFAQIDYGSLTKFERNYLKRLFPFYSFMSRSFPPVLDEIINRPGGRFGVGMRVLNRGREENATTPDYVGESTSMPWKLPFLQAPEGTNRFVTGLGLMFEDPLSLGVPLAAGKAQDFALEGMSRLTPALRVPLEMATGQVFFQRGPSGGRDIEDLDPPIARLVNNIMGDKDRQRSPIPSWSNQDAWRAGEMLVGATPASRLVTQLRQATDTRKQLPVKALNLLTGLRVTDVSPAAQDAILRERATKLMKSLGARDFQEIYFRPEDKAAMRPSKREQAESLEGLQNLIDKRRRQRKKERNAKVNLEP